METRLYEREKLYKEVWEEPMTALATRYGISDVALRKHCKKMSIPLPKSGHWTKVKLGKEVSIPPLPESDGPDKIEVQVHSVDNDKQLGMKMSEILSFLSEEERINVTKYCLSIKVPEKLTKTHDLIKMTKLYYGSKKDVDQYTISSVINLDKISDELKSRVYRFYNTLFTALEHLGYKIEINVSKSYGYNRRVVDNKLSVSLGENRIPIYIKEMQKRIEHKPTDEELKNSFWSIPSYDYINTGKLHFGIDSYHAKRKNWRDTEIKVIEDQIGEIVLWIMEAIHVEKVKKEEREAERNRRIIDQQIQEQIAERRENELKQLDNLNQLATNWEKANRIRKFADALELKIASINEKEEKEQLLNWLKWARDKADWMDPLVEKDDEILRGNLSFFNKVFRNNPEY